MNYQVTCPICRGRLGVNEALFGSYMRCSHCDGTFLVGQLNGTGGALGRPFSFACSLCHSRLEAYTGQVGQVGQCPTCGAEFRVPPPDQLADRQGGTEPEREYAQPVHAYAAAGAKAPKIVRKPDGQKAIECPRCRTLNAVTRNNCLHCALPFTLEGAERDAPGSGFGTAALVLGIVSLPTCFVLLTPLAAMIFGGIALARSDPAASGRGQAIAGLILGVVALLLALLAYTH